MTNKTPELPSRYTKPKPYGGGGFGDIFICKDTHLERDVILKKIRDETQNSRLQDEIFALLKITSKHVVQVYEIFKFEDSSYGILMEHIDGNDLMDNSQFLGSENDLLETLWQIASGIEDIHSSGIIHRDIKPNNMILDSEGIIKIFDFGLSRKNGPDAFTYGFVGTEMFASPELYKNSHVEFTNAVDVYSFGVMTMYLSQKSFAPELLEIPPREVPRGSFNNPLLNKYPMLINLFERSLSPLPDDRPSISEIRKEIQKYLLFGKHKALLTHMDKTTHLDINKKIVRLRVQGLGSCEISYDGLDFKVNKVQGEVFINNRTPSDGSCIPGCCVITIGDSSRYPREFITFDISNPEVVL